jgi:hypothetical protein
MSHLITEAGDQANKALTWQRRPVCPLRHVSSCVGDSRSAGLSVRLKSSDRYDTPL